MVPEGLVDAEVDCSIGLFSGHQTHESQSAPHGGVVCHLSQYWVVGRLEILTELLDSGGQTETDSGGHQQHGTGHNSYEYSPMEAYLDSHGFSGVRQGMY